jgi:tol-pal system protein YbgF
LTEKSIIIIEFNTFDHQVEIMNIIKSISILSLLTLSGLLSACVAGTSPAVMGVAPTSELSSIEQKLEENTAQVQRLQDSLVMLEVRLLDQQRLVEELRRKVAGGEFASGAAPASGAASASKKSPTEIYRTAFGDYAAGNYEKSIDGFSSFLRHFPANDYAGNARFWMAECYLAMENYEQAAIEFENVFIDFPQGSKAADALLKMAAAQYQLNQTEKAQETIQLLKERYPKSAAARKAEQAYE